MLAFDNPYYRSGLNRIPNSPLRLNRRVSGANRLCLADQLLTVDGLAEVLECGIEINVINHQYAAGSQGVPCSGHLEQHVVFAVVTVMHEDVDGSDCIQQLGQSPPTWTRDERPLFRWPRAHRSADFAV